MLKFLTFTFTVLIISGCQPNLKYSDIVSNENVLLLRNYSSNPLNPKIGIITQEDNSFKDIMSLVNYRTKWTTSSASYSNSTKQISGKNFNLFIYNDFVRLTIDSKQYIKTIPTANLAPLFTDINTASRYGAFIGRGKIIKEKYTFCGIVPIEIKYNYKVDHWTFWDENYQIFANGTFETTQDTVQTNCSGITTVKKGYIDVDKWDFASNITGKTDMFLQVIEENANLDF